MELVLAHEGEDRIVAQIARAERLNRSFGQVTFCSTQHRLRLKSVDQLFFNFFFEATGITLDANYETARRYGGFEPPGNRLPACLAVIAQVRYKNYRILIVVRDLVRDVWLWHLSFGIYPRAFPRTRPSKNKAATIDCCRWMIRAAN